MPLDAPSEFFEPAKALQILVQLTVASEPAGPCGPVAPVGP